jgi:peptidoglycan/xylan/chitin deacetylase (PgdA/CDA1 family)
MSLSQRILSKLKREGNYLLRDIGYQLGLYNRFYSSARGSRIMIYHGICLDDHLRFNMMFLKFKTFENHLKFYKKYFNVISLDDYYQQKFSNDKFNICLTFDDGFANNYEYVLPLLKKYQMPATFFITAVREKGYDVLWNDFLSIVSKYGPKEVNYDGETYYKSADHKYISAQTGIDIVAKLHVAGIEKKNLMMEEVYPQVPFKTNIKDKDYWLQMTESQIRDLAQSPLISIGAHGYYHNDLSEITIEDAKQELQESKQYLENLIGKPVTSLAFPYGTYNQEVAGEAKKAGYDQLLVLDFYHEEDQHDPMMRERFTVSPLVSTNNQMYASIIRSYGFE